MTTEFLNSLDRYSFLNDLFRSGELSGVSALVVETLFDEMVDIARDIL